MKRTILTLGVGLLLAACGAGPSAPSATQDVAALSHRDSGPVCFFADPNFQGASLCASQARAWLGRRWNDRISSVKVAPGYGVEVFEHRAYGGKSLKLQADAASLSERGFDDLISSFKISRAQPDTTPPTGSNLTLSSYSVTDATLVTASVEASDDVGVVRVEFYIGPYRVAEVTSAPYSATFDPTTGVLSGNTTRIPNGDYTARAVVYDAAGNSTQVPGGAVLVLLPR